MISQYIHGRVAVFIDAGNIWYLQKALGWRVGYQRLIDFIRQESESVCYAGFYTAIDDTDINQPLFIYRVVDAGFQVVQKPIKSIAEKVKNTRKGNMDVEIALDAYIKSDEYDSILLFSGDSDFAYLIDLLKQKRKAILVISSRKAVSRELVERAKFININTLREYIEYK